jgi:hypothetical protein
MKEKPERPEKPEKRCKIEVNIPKGADVVKLEAAVNEALKTKLTNAVVESCEEITIMIRRFPR